MRDWLPVAPDDLDLHSAGRRAYSVRVPYVRQGRPDALDLPVVVVSSGEGHRVMVSGGTHGDEYEGQHVAALLARTVRPEDVSGTLVLVPALNRPAAIAGTRRSPVDGLDINRLFPGGDEEGPSHAIARFVCRRLVSTVDTVIDIHSGGTATEFVLSSNLQGRLGDPRTDAEIPALLSCDAPYALVFDEAGDLSMPHRGTLEGAATAMDKRAFSSEFGGGGRMTERSARVAEASVRNLLAYLEVLPARGRPPRRSRSRLLTLSRPDQHVGAPADGQFLPNVRLGQDVATGQTLGQICAIAEPGMPAIPVVAASGGVIVGIASQGTQRKGGCLFFVGEPAAC